MSRRYRIRNFDGTFFESEGELAEWNGNWVVLDGAGKPWLLLTEQDSVGSQDSNDASDGQGEVADLLTEKTS